MMVVVDQLLTPSWLMVEWPFFSVYLHSNLLKKVTTL
jgi:hypothetical protein